MESTNALPFLTASRLRDARACQRRHKYRYLDGYVPLEDASPLRFGTMFHNALEAWWKETSDDNRLAAAVATIPTGGDPFEAAMCRALMAGYDSRYKPLNLTVIAVEQEFRVPLVNPETGQASRTWALAGKLDVIAQDDRAVVEIEHKTSSEDISPGSPYWKRLKLDGQQSMYFIGARAAGYPIEKCLYDVIGKPKLRPFKATPEADRKYTREGSLYKNQHEHDETPAEFEIRLLTAIAEEPDRYYARGTVVRLDSEIDEAMADVWTLAKQLREADLADRFPRNPDACIQYGRTCAFFGVCCGEERLDDETKFKRLDNVHPELTA